jgi:chloride channel 3/4/5
MSSHFPRKVLWRAFMCSMSAAICLKLLNPSRTGKLVLFETNYGVVYHARHYALFILLGICGGLFGALFCKGSRQWIKFTKPFVDRHPLFELAMIAGVTALLQFPNPITREPALLMIKSLLSDCRHAEDSWICRQEQLQDRSSYYGWLAYGSAVKIIMTILTTGSRSMSFGLFFLSSMMLANGLLKFLPVS